MFLSLGWIGLRSVLSRLSYLPGVSGGGGCVNPAVLTFDASPASATLLCLFCVPSSPEMIVHATGLAIAGFAISRVAWLLFCRLRRWCLFPTDFDFVGPTGMVLFFSREIRGRGHMGRRFRLRDTFFFCGQNSPPCLVVALGEVLFSCFCVFVFSPWKRIYSRLLCSPFVVSLVWCFRALACSNSLALSAENKKN